MQHQDWWIRPKQKQIPPPKTCYDDVMNEVDVQDVQDLTVRTGTHIKQSMSEEQRLYCGEVSCTGLQHFLC